MDRWVVTESSQVDTSLEQCCPCVMVDCIHILTGFACQVTGGWCSERIIDTGVVFICMACLLQ